MGPLKKEAYESYVVYTTKKTISGPFPDFN